MSARFQTLIQSTDSRVHVVEDCARFAADCKSVPRLRHLDLRTWLAAGKPARIPSIGVNFGPKKSLISASTQPGFIGNLPCPENMLLIALPLQVAMPQYQLTSQHCFLLYRVNVSACFTRLPAAEAGSRLCPTLTRGSLGSICKLGRRHV